MLTPEQVDKLITEMTQNRNDALKRNDLQDASYWDWELEQLISNE